jgi:hypothetical protein
VSILRGEKGVGRRSVGSRIFTAVTTHRSVMVDICTAEHCAGGIGTYTRNVVVSMMMMMMMMISATGIISGIFGRHFLSTLQPATEGEYAGNRMYLVKYFKRQII